MKLMFCEDCQTLVVPAYADMVLRACRCGRHSCWWVDGNSGIFAVLDHEAMMPPARPRAFVIGISNMLFNWPELETEKNFQDSIGAHGPNYLFSQRRSLIVRFRPGETGDSSWASALPRR